MATLSKDTLRKLVVLHALSQWRRGAFGLTRVQKTLFFAEHEAEPRLFTFKRYYFGQYSDDLAPALNGLQRACRLECRFDGSAERLVAVLDAEDRDRLRRAMRRLLPAWCEGFKTSFQEWGLLKHDELLEKAHEDPTYTEYEHDEVIHRSTLRGDFVSDALDDAEAEWLADLVDERLQRALSTRFSLLGGERGKPEPDWESKYFS